MLALSVGGWVVVLLVVLVAVVFVAWVAARVGHRWEGDDDNDV